MNTKCSLVAASLLGIGAIVSYSQAQMIPLARYSIVSASASRFPGPPIGDYVFFETRDFLPFNQTVSLGLGGAASQFSSLGASTVNFNATASGGPGGGGFHGAGSSSLTFDFRLVNECSFDLAGNMASVGVYGAWGRVKLSRTDVASTLFEVTNTGGSFHPTGSLPIGTYRFECTSSGPDGVPNQALSATLYVVPSPSTPLVVGAAVMAGMSRHRRTLGRRE